MITIDLNDKEKYNQKKKVNFIQRNIMKAKGNLKSKNIASANPKIKQNIGTTSKAKFC